MLRRYYKAFGFVLSSDFAFPDMEETDRRDVDITINRRAFTKIDQRDDAPWTTHSIGLDEQIFVWKTVGAFRITGGRVIDVDPVEGVDSKILSLPLFGAVFATLLHMRGMLVLHASAVVRSSKCAIFLGDKGAGKSTTAFAMIKAGYELLSDDVVAITFNEAGQPQVLPAFNQVKLLDDTAKKFGLDLSRAEQIHPQVEKRRHRADGAFCNDTAEVAAVYVLDRDKDGEVVPFAPDEALRALIGFSYASRFGSEAFPPQIAMQHLQACGQLIRTAIVGKLVAPDTLERIEDAVALVNEALLPAGPTKAEARL